EPRPPLLFRLAPRAAYFPWAPPILAPPLLPPLEPPLRESPRSLSGLDFRDRLPNFPHSPARDGRAFEHLSGIPFSQSLQALMPFFWGFQFANLRRGHDERAAVLLEPIPEL